MKSFEQIAKAIYEAFVKQVSISAEKNFPSYSQLNTTYQSGWVAAAQAAHKEFMEVH